MVIYDNINLHIQQLHKLFSRFVIAEEEDVCWEGTSGVFD